MKRFHKSYARCSSWFCNARAAQKAARKPPTKFFSSPSAPPRLPQIHSALTNDIINILINYGKYLQHSENVVPESSVLAVAERESDESHHGPCTCCWSCCYGTSRPLGLVYLFVSLLFSPCDNKNSICPLKRDSCRAREIF
jgi:hypothetical protein